MVLYMDPGRTFSEKEVSASHGVRWGARICLHLSFPLHRLKVGWFTAIDRRIVFQCLEAFKNIIIVSRLHPRDSEESHVSSFSRIYESFYVVVVGSDTHVVSTSPLVKDITNEVVTRNCWSLSFSRLFVD